MNLEFKDEVRRGGFRPTAESEAFEDRLRGMLGLTAKYESARLAMGRSLAETHPPEPVPAAAGKGKPIPGDILFGAEIDLWLSAFILDGDLGAHARVDDFRALVEAHWSRGARLLQADLENARDDEVKFISRLADLLPDSSSDVGRGHSLEPSLIGEVRVPVGSVSTTFPEGEPVAIALNAPGAAPHIALMGKNGSGKTWTGVQIAIDIQAQAGLPMLFIDPKGEFVSNGKLTGRLANAPFEITPIQVGDVPIPLDFLPDPSIGSISITKAAMQFRDSLALCCKSVGNIQAELLRQAVEKVIKNERLKRSLPAIKDWYEQELAHNNKPADSVVSRLSELTALKVFDPSMAPSEFFRRSWVLSLNTLGSEELKRLVILLVLDSLRSFVLSQPDAPVPGGFRSLRHLLVIDEARRILAEKKYQSLIDLVRQGRSKGEVVILLSQDPSDFDGQQEDFTTQLGTVLAFACNQSKRGLRSLEGAYGRRLQTTEFTDTYLPVGVAFAKLPNRAAERVHCWEPTA